MEKTPQKQEQKIKQKKENAITKLNQNKNGQFSYFYMDTEPLKPKGES